MEELTSLSESIGFKLTAKQTEEAVKIAKDICRYNVICDGCVTKDGHCIHILQTAVTLAAQGYVSPTDSKF